VNSACVAVAPVCGDGVVQAGEQCDDGNLMNGDSCTASCQIPALPTCNDGLKNGAETDIDCGGVCGTCAQGKACLVGGDCSTGTCTAGICAAPPALLPLGSACSAATQCGSSFCVDGFCANTACTGICQSASAAKKGGGANGVCGSIQFGSDPDSECAAQGASTCGTTGACNGAGACQLYAAGTVCAAASCASPTIALQQSTCNGTGTCFALAPVDCSATGRVCSAGVCVAPQ
jgi:cysteine-rich repeat protein